MKKAAEAINKIVNELKEEHVSALVIVIDDQGNYSIRRSVFPEHEKQMLDTLEHNKLAIEHGANIGEAQRGLVGCDMKKSQ